MRNIVAYCILILLLIWLFIDGIYMSALSENVRDNNEIDSSVASKYNSLDVNLRKLSALLGVEYNEESPAEKVEIKKEFDVSLEVVLIYTSHDKQKVRLSKLVNETKDEIDLQLGEQLYNYRLSEINPSYIVFDDGHDKKTLKAFETVVISVLDLPKEKLE